MKMTNKETVEILLERIAQLKEIRNEIAESDKELTLATFVTAAVEEDDGHNVMTSVFGPGYMVTEMVNSYLDDTNAEEQFIVQAMLMEDILGDAE